MDLSNRLLAKYDQIVIFGAKGWVGRSAVELLLREQPDLIEDQILLIGRKTEPAAIADLPLNVYSHRDALERVKSRALFLNAAFLRREKIDEVGLDEYGKQNRELTNFGLELVTSGRVKAFVNLSSGVASQGTFEKIELVEDNYARLKIEAEAQFSAACNLMRTQLINCRIYSMSGKYMNEFVNLALSSFISQARIDTGLIRVKSPSTLRTFVDAIELVQVLFELSLTQNNYQIDSGGTLVSLRDLAEQISEIHQGTKVEIPNTFEKSADYFGNYLEFNKLANDFGVQLKNIKEQIIETSQAFS